MFERVVIVSAALLMGACAAMPRAGPQPQCAQTSFPTNNRIGAWSVDKFAGRYLGGSDAITVSRDEHRLLVRGWTLGTRELTADSVESWTWRDGCGVRYDFMLPPDGPGAWLKVTMTDGSVTDWKR
jgi:hypothetical protein